MKFKILSRAKIEKISQQPFEEGTALISITDAGYHFAELKHQPEHLLQLAFDDVDGDVFVDELGRKPTTEELKLIEGKYNMLSDEQAKQIAEFYFKICKDAKMLIVQCEHGQSRSAAIGAAILEFRSRKGIHIFADERFCPNKMVYHKVFNQLNIQNGGM